MAGHPHCRDEIGVASVLIGDAANDPAPGFVAERSGEGMMTFRCVVGDHGKLVAELGPDPVTRPPVVPLAFLTDGLAAIYTVVQVMRIVNDAVEALLTFQIDNPYDLSLFDQPPQLPRGGRNW